MAMLLLWFSYLPFFKVGLTPVVLERRSRWRTILWLCGGSNWLLNWDNEGTYVKEEKEKKTFQ